ncbi:hypothetical protein ACGFIF_17240 [Kribbella sp. NPDC049174]|uniref:hypothetical protein n=1 Tax=Kribbella sp. NPDC049174 TaxID=3364112 RepID=UPI003718103A
MVGVEPVSLHDDADRLADQAAGLQRRVQRLVLATPAERGRSQVREQHAQLARDSALIWFGWREYMLDPAPLMGFLPNWSANWEPIPMSSAARGPVDRARLIVRMSSTWTIGSASAAASHGPSPS